MTSTSPSTNGLVHIGGTSHAHADHADRSVPREKWQALRPTTAQIYVENRCHLHCAHCYESATSHPHHKHDEQLSLAAYEQLFDELAALGVLFITFTGGEVFLRKDFLDVVAAARARRFAVSVYTSGTLLDEARADRLRELRVAEVHISVYSHDAATHDAFTGSVGAHAKSLRALTLLRERGVRTVVKANVLRFNVDHLDALARLARDHGAALQLDPSIRSRMDGDRTPIELVVSPDEIRRRILVRPELAPAFRKHRAEDLCSGERSVLDGDDVMCGAARSQISIGADGGVSACGYFPTSGGRWTAGAPGSLADIWFGSSQFDDVRSMTFAKMTECPSCEVKTTCNPCMAYGLVENGSISACNSASRHGALAVRLLAEQKARANVKMSRGGRSLPIVGDHNVDVGAGIDFVATLNTEP